MTEPSPGPGYAGQAAGAWPGQPNTGWGGQATNNPATGWSGAAAGPATMTRPQPAISAAYPATRERTARLVIRRISPWSVLKVSFLVYCCLEVVAALVFAVAWEVLNRLGTFNAVEGFANKLSIHLTFPAAKIFLYYIASGFGIVVLATIATVLFTLLFNLVCDIVGGVELTLAERSGRPR